MSVILEESSSISTIFFRKSMKIKIIETLIFILLVIVLSVMFNSSDSIFKIGVIAGGIFILTFSPIIYKMIIKPKYILTDTHLIIEKAGIKKEIPITDVDQTYDLKFFYLIEGKKTPLMISNVFIEELNKKIDQLKRNKKKH